MKIDLHQHPTRPDIYVTPDGRVFRELPVTPSGYGYHSVYLGGHGRSVLRRHTIVAQTFLGPAPEPGMQVRHLDGDSSNDHKDNLRWGTAAENGADCIAHGRSGRGETHPRAKLTAEQVLEIRERRAGGEAGVALAEEFGVTKEAIYNIQARRTWTWL
jgi:hypothetical protein